MNTQLIIHGIIELLIISAIIILFNRRITKLDTIINNYDEKLLMMNKQIIKQNIKIDKLIKLNSKIKQKSSRENVESSDEDSDDDYEHSIMKEMFKNKGMSRQQPPPPPPQNPLSNIFSMFSSLTGSMSSPISNPIKQSRPIQPQSQPTVSVMNDEDDKILSESLNTLLSNKLNSKSPLKKSPSDLNETKDTVELDDSKEEN